MKPGIPSPIIFAALTLGVIISLTGCASSGMKRSAQADTSMKAVEADYKQAVAQVNTTGAALQELVKPGQSNVKKAFNKFSDNAKKMENVEKKLFEHADKMRDKGKEYFNEWRSQGNTYSNPQIQALSEQRRAELSAVVARIPEASIGVKGAIQAYMSDIREIQTFLSNDLTTKGVEAISPIAQKAVRDGDGLKDAINPVLYAISMARAELEQGGAKP